MPKIKTIHRSTHFRTALQSIVLTAFAMIAVLSIVNSLPETPKGDTTFAWLPVLLLFAYAPFAALTLLMGISKNPLSAAARMGTLVVLFFLAPLLTAGLPDDGFPLTVRTVLVWLFGLAVALMPAALLFSQSETAKSLDAARRTITTCATIVLLAIAGSITSIHNGYTKKPDPHTTFSYSDNETADTNLTPALENSPSHEAMSAHYEKLQQSVFAELATQLGPIDWRQTDAGKTIVCGDRPGDTSGRQQTMPSWVSNTPISNVSRDRALLIVEKTARLYNFDDIEKTSNTYLTGTDIYGGTISFSNWNGKQNILSWRATTGCHLPAANKP